MYFGLWHQLMMTRDIFLDEAEKALLIAPAARLYIHLLDASLPGCALSLHWRDRWETPVNPLSFQHLTATLDLCRIISRAHMTEQNHVLACTLDVQAPAACSNISPRRYSLAHLKEFPGLWAQAVPTILTWDFPFITAVAFAWKWRQLWTSHPLWCAASTLVEMDTHFRAVLVHALSGYLEQMPFPSAVISSSAACLAADPAAAHFFALEDPESLLCDMWPQLHTREMLNSLFLMQSIQIVADFPWISIFKWQTPLFVSWAAGTQFFLES